jgi:hypothetical protein
MNLQTITLTITVDLDELNNALGNTPNVTLKDAMMEMLNFKKDKSGIEDAIVPFVNTWEVSPHTTYEG